MDDALKAKGEHGKLYGMMFPALVLLGSGCYLRALIVLLRLLAVKKPMNFEEVHHKVGRTGSIIAWTSSLLVYLLIFLLYLPSIVKRNLIIACYFVALKYIATKY